MKISWITPALLLLTACSISPRKVFRKIDFENDILFAKNSKTAVLRARELVRSDPKEFYTYALLGDAYQYSTKFDSASYYYEIADFIFTKQSSGLDNYRKMLLLNDESVWRYQDLLIRMMENYLILNQKEKVLTILNRFEGNFFLKNEKGSSVKYPEDKLDFNIKQIFASSCGQVDSLVKHTIMDYDTLKIWNRGVVWRNNGDLKVYIELYELTGKMEFLDSANVLLLRREVTDRMSKFYRLRWLVNHGQADSVDIKLSMDSTLYAGYLRGRLRSLAKGEGYYGTKPCKK